MEKTLKTILKVFHFSQNSVPRIFDDDNNRPDLTIRPFDHTVPYEPEYHQKQQQQQQQRQQKVI
ncbi:hypothetical protein DERF_010096 [Dermatophagoides farinae]|uniref:Uncharacterized protein n=1 Tax=Dermatophagoides farinae TaxID=6954 RepID=A0A922HZC5_DERFA|nr:hypothetical protein DERF_010096 [Dermatophagoides farinae]